MNMPPPPPPSEPPPVGYESYSSPGGPARPHPQGTLVLVLGIASLFICGIILGVIAFVMGTNALKEVDQNPSAYSNRSSINAGRICGAIGAILSVVFFIVLVTR